MTGTCEKDGVHRLPEGEDSWNSERCDALVAAGLDQCLPCQNQIISEVSESLTDDFGRLFTTWVMTTLNRHVALGATVPDTALEIFGSASRAALSPPSRKALRGVKLPRITTPEAAVGVSFDASTAVTALTAMKTSEREAVLNDAMDGIIASIALPLPTRL